MAIVDGQVTQGLFHTPASFLLFLPDKTRAPIPVLPAESGWDKLFQEVGPSNF